VAEHRLPPFAVGSVSLGLSAVGEDAPSIAARLLDEAVAAVTAGFDGVTLSEHHGGFPRYVPSPLALSAGLLGRLPTGWAVAAPSVLPLRRPVPVAEDLAWLAALYPGRVGAGFVPGYQRRDFDLVGADFEARQATFWTDVATVRHTLGPDSPLAADPALAAAADVPVLAGIGGPVGARRAARTGVGLLLTSLRPPAEQRPVVEAYREAGGTGPVMLIRRVHVGAVAADAGFAASEADWRPEAEASANWLSADGDALVTGPPAAIAEQLAGALADSGATALNLRIDAHTSHPELVADQIAMIGTDVLPALRRG
jgi:alkanesulfonate monooxygenase SsuD/methylene tetrahydromethanopterin reductase-like flavin-dependent oxidoreductase (luciferase family)